MQFRCVDKVSNEEILRRVEREELMTRVMSEKELRYLDMY